MSETRTTFQRWSAYRASNTALFWSCVLCVMLTMVVGFTWGGWVTGRTANSMAVDAGAKARTDLAASICVSRFMKGANVKADLATLKKTSSWDRADLLEKDGWTVLPGQQHAVDGAADACAQQLAAMQPPADNQPVQANGSTAGATQPKTVQQ